MVVLVNLLFGLVGHLLDCFFDLRFLDSTVVTLDSAVSRIRHLLFYSFDWLICCVLIWINGLHPMPRKTVDVVLVEVRICGAELCV